jgi:hypothetical protein
VVRDIVGPCGALCKHLSRLSLTFLQRSVLTQDEGDPAGARRRFNRLVTGRAHLRSSRFEPFGDGRRDRPAGAARTGDESATFLTIYP